MTSAFSITRLFVAPEPSQAPPTLAQNLVGAVMTQWDAVSFSNTVNVGPVTYRNLPVVSPNGLTVGTVLLEKGPAGYIIMGMLGNASEVTFIDPVRYRVLPADVSISSTTMASVGILNFLLNTNTQYGIDGEIFMNSPSVGYNFAWNGPADMAVNWGIYGPFDTAVSGITAQTQQAYGDGTTVAVSTNKAPQLCKPGAWFATTDTPGILQMRCALQSGTTAGTIQKGSWLRIMELAPTGGTTTHVNIYPATGSRSYDHNGNPIGSPDQDNNLYTWSLSGRNFGSEQHMWTFNAAQMRTDLAGATILAAQMYLYCFASSGSTADLTYEWCTVSTIQATMPTTGFGGADIKSAWTPPGWGNFDISGQMTNILNHNANSVLGGSYHFSDSSSGFRGFGFSVATIPYIQIVYAA